MKLLGYISLALAVLGTSQLAAGERAAAKTGQEIFFERDVMAVLSKAGCNMGTCHGNQNGKAGFRSSLRGQSADDDYRSLAVEGAGRRCNPFEPDDSLLLLKPTMQLAHEGGKRFSRDSAEYKILRDWIAAGMPKDPKDAPKLVRLEVSPREQFLTEPVRQAQIAVTAIFSDDARRDVSAMAVYEPSSQIVAIDHDGLAKFNGFGEVSIGVRYLHCQTPVRLAYIPARPDFAWSNPPEANYIDKHVFAKLRQLRINPSELCSDNEFIRRAFLDGLGVLPTMDEAKAFVADTAPDKRARLIDALLERPEFAEFWSRKKWSDLLRNEQKVLDTKGVRVFHEWIRSSIDQDKPLSEFVKEIVTAEGSTYAIPAANFYRANRDAVTRAESAAQVFLGVRLGCAKCHNHPFDHWTQEDYYSWTAVFSHVDYKIVENRRRDENDKHEFIGEQLVLTSGKEEIKDPRSGKVMQPRFLGAEDSIAPDEHRLKPLGDWLTSGENSLFVRSQVNRVWFHLLGRGIVDPLDDFRETNPAVNPELLTWLSKDFVEHGFKLKHLVRQIMNSRSYQLSAEPNDTNRDDASNFSRSLVRRLTAEQLLDAVSHATATSIEFDGYPLGTRASQVAGVPIQRRGEEIAMGDQFLRQFGKPPRLLTCECERSAEGTLGHALQMLSGQALSRMLSTSDNRIGAWIAANKRPAEMLDELYWTALSRAPTGEELAAATAHLESTGDRRAALEDITWAVLNSKEFILRK